MPEWDQDSVVQKQLFRTSIRIIPHLCIEFLSCFSDEGIEFG
jgi:hypothetical protein